MKTKIVYVLVCGESDYYYEQTLISATSARMWNPDAEIDVVVDDRTNEVLKGKREALIDIIQRKIVVNLPEDLNNKRRSRILKTSLRELIVGDFLYIDADTVVCDSLSEVDDFQCEIGAVLDRHTTLQRVRDYQILERIESLGGTFSDGEAYYNSGVLFVKDTEKTHSFFSDWNALYKKGLAVGLDFDQPPLLLCNQKHNLIELCDGSYNCQIFLGGLPFLGNARIIHAFNIFGFSSFFLFNDIDFYEKLKMQGTFDEEDMSRLRNAKCQFQGDYVLYYGKNLDYAKSVLFHLFTDNRSLFNFLEKVGSMMLFLYRKLK